MTHTTQDDRFEAAPAVPFPDEATHLAMMLETLDAAVQAANEEVVRIDKEYRDAKRYMADYRGELDSQEMRQNETGLAQMDESGTFAVNVRERLTKLKQSPYFARIDFQEEEEDAATKYYIGRFAFSLDNELLIFDWRAPIASMFYDCEVGPASYEAPMGTISGQLARKRQFKVKDGILEYTLESSVNIQDDVLQRELSHTSDEKMKSIIATIQKEQNLIIRNEKSSTMIIQGVAGSGKTSIALHRIAFLLYRFKARLSAQNVTILSPNKVFGDYISTVLPELGEQPIAELSFWDIAVEQLRGVIGFELEKDPLETQDEAWAQRVRFKSTRDFVAQMNAYLTLLPALVFQPEDCVFGGFCAQAEWIQSRFDAYKNYPIKKRLTFIADDIQDRFATDNPKGEKVPKTNAILKTLNAMLKMKSTFALYKHFYAWLKRPDLLVLPQKQTLEWADIFPFLYLHEVFVGLAKSKLIRHLVVDEMQDYTPIQYTVINRLYPCQKTILGDFGQFINPNHLYGLADLQALYPDASLVQLNKSYRSTYEIIMFANAIQQVQQLEPMKRHGEAPQIIACGHEQDELNAIKNKLDGFLKAGGVSLGIVLKTNREALALYEALAPFYELQHIAPDSTRFVNGICVTSIQMAKGLEFDAVIVPSANNNTYFTQYDKSLLYIACTRAMHALTLLYTGQPSCLLPPEMVSASPLV